MAPWRARAVEAVFVFGSILRTVIVEQSAGASMTTAVRIGHGAQPAPCHTQR
jgi:hypothetical protein